MLTPYVVGGAVAAVAAVVAALAVHHERRKAHARVATIRAMRLAERRLYWTLWRRYQDVCRDRDRLALAGARPQLMPVDAAQLGVDAAADSRRALAALTESEH